MYLVYNVHVNKKAPPGAVESKPGARHTRRHRYYSTASAELQGGILYDYQRKELSVTRKARLQF